MATITNIKGAHFSLQIVIIDIQYLENAFYISNETYFKIERKNLLLLGINNKLFLFPLDKNKTLSIGVDIKCLEQKQIRVHSSSIEQHLLNTIIIGM